MDVAASIGLGLALIVMRLRAGRRVSPGRYLEPLLFAALAAFVVFEGPSALLRLSYFLVAFLVAGTNEVDPQGTRNRSRWWLPAVFVALCVYFDPGNRAPWAWVGFVFIVGLALPQLRRLSQGRRGAGGFQKPSST